MGSNKILTGSGWIDVALRDKVTELLYALLMDEGVPFVSITTGDGFDAGPIEDEAVVRILLELAKMVNVEDGT